MISGNKSLWILITFFWETVVSFRSPPRSPFIRLRFNDDTPACRLRRQREAISHYRYRLIPRSVLDERPRSARPFIPFVRPVVKRHPLPAGADAVRAIASNVPIIITFGTALHFSFFPNLLRTTSSFFTRSRVVGGPVLPGTTARDAFGTIIWLCVSDEIRHQGCWTSWLFKLYGKSL